MIRLALAAAPPADAGGGVFSIFLEYPFATAIGCVFLVAIIGAFVAARKKDRCLKRFKAYMVVVAEQGGREMWGRLKVFSKGLELEYEAPYDKPIKRSFLFYEGDLGRLLAIYRFKDRLRESTARDRDRQVGKLADPPTRSRVWRWLRNIVNTFRDATVQAMGMGIQHATAGAKNPVLASQTGSISTIGTTLIGETANAYEPIIEQYIGDPVILELTNPADPEKRRVEYHGHMGEYSAQYVLLLDLDRTFRRSVPLAGETSLLEQMLRIRPAEEGVHVENASYIGVTVEAIEAGENRHPVNRTVGAGESTVVALPEGVAPADAAIAVAWQRQFDMVVPRNCGIIRHASD